MALRKKHIDDGVRPGWICTHCGSTFEVYRERCLVDGHATAPDLTGLLVAGRYRLERIIDTGGMASVIWDAADVRGGRVAVKVVLEMEGNTAKYFVEGSQLSTRFEHENCTRVYQTGVLESGYHYVVMERLKGAVLCDLVNKGGICDDTLLEVAEQVLAGLEHMHGQGVLHRDIKPSNLFLHDTGEGRAVVKLLDYGIAAPFDVPGEGGEARRAAEVEGAGEVWLRPGTPQYMSPEQILGRGLDARSDVYAVGVLMYRLMTGEVPFQGGSAQEVYEGHLHRVPAAFAEVCPGRSFPEGLEVLVRRAMRKQPEERFESVTAMRRMLQVVRRLYREKYGPCPDLRELLGYAPNPVTREWELRKSVEDDSQLIALANARRLYGATGEHGA